VHFEIDRKNRLPVCSTLVLRCTTGVLSDRSPDAGRRVSAREEAAMAGALRGLVTRDRGRLAAEIAAVAVAYWAAAMLALQLALVRDQVSPLWLPTGIALACLIWLGIRCWPGVMIGAFAANLFVGSSLAGVLVIAVGNTLAPVVACSLLRWFKFRPELDRLRDAVGLVFLGALVAMLISSTIGAGILWVTGAVSNAEFWMAWSVWWAGDAMGVLTVTPVLLVARRMRWPRASLLRWLEAFAVPLTAIAVLGLSQTTSTPLFFLVFPVLVWAAVRFQLRGAVPCALLVSLATSIAAVRGRGPFGDLSLLGKMITLHAYNASTALIALLLSALTIERMHALLAVERAVTQLTDAVAALEPYRLLSGGVLDGVLKDRRP
jgi:integral membrane sensor domain MASE1